MSILASDNFNRANETPLSGGGNWTTQTGSNAFNLSSNVAVPSVVNNDDVSVYTAGTWPNDHYSQADLTVTSTAGGDQGIGLVVRASAAAVTHYRAVADHAASGNISIDKAVAGVYTTLSSGTSSWTNGATWELDVQGTTLTFKRAGTTILSTTNASIASGKPGIMLSSNVTSASVDNWAGGDFSSSNIVTPGTAALSLTPFPPTVTATANQTVTPGTASLILTPQTPSIIVGEIVTPGTANLTLTPHAPTITATANQVVTPGTAALSLTPFPPTVSASNDQTVTPGTAALVLTPYPPTVTVSGSQVVTPGPAALILTAYPPDVRNTTPRLHVTPGILHHPTFVVRQEVTFHLTMRGTITARLIVDRPPPPPVRSARPTAPGRARRSTEKTLQQAQLAAVREAEQVARRQALEEEELSYALALLLSDD